MDSDEHLSVPCYDPIILLDLGLFSFYNRPFPSCLVPLPQSESWCIAFHMKMSFHSHADKTHFRMKDFTRDLALRKRHKTIRKWPIPNAYCLEWCNASFAFSSPALPVQCCLQSMGMSSRTQVPPA